MAQIIIDNTFEAMALRGVLEYFGFQMNMHYGGKAKEKETRTSAVKALSSLQVFVAYYIHTIYWHTLLFTVLDRLL